MNAFFRQKSPLLLFAICLLVTCKKDEEAPRDYPRINTLSVTNITENGAVFNGNVYSISSETIIDHGFAWSESENFMIFEYTDRISLGALSGTGSFSAKINTTLEAKKKYYVRSFIKTANHLVCGKVVSFESLGSGAPIITGFEPKTAGWGDTLTINGKNFSWHGSTNKVYIGTVLVNTTNPTIKSTDTTIKVVVPLPIITLKNIIGVEIANNRANFTKDTFKLYPPTIIDFIPRQGHWGDTITIYGKYLDYISKNSTPGSLLLNQNTSSKIINITKDSISFIVPNNIQMIKNSLSLYINGLFANTSFIFYLTPPLITDFKPKIATWNDQVTIYGNFNPNSALSSVYFNNILATINTTYKDSIKVKVPTTLTIGSSTISYKSNNFTVTAASSFQLSPPIITSFTPTTAISGESITINGNYFSTADTKVYFNTKQGTINSLTNTTIKVSVPSAIETPTKIKVISCNQPIIADGDLTITNPKITSISPTTATFDDTIYISGENLNIGLSYYVSTTNINLPVVYHSPTLLKVLVPRDIYYLSNRITLNTLVKGYAGNSYFTTLSTENFSLLLPIISSFSPNSGNRGQEVTIQGSNFNPSKEYNVVYFGNVQATTISASRTELKVNNNKLTSGDHKIKLTSNGYQIESSELYSCSDPWKELSGLTVNGDISYSYTINSYGYSLSLSNSTWTLRKFDPASNTWTTLRAPTYVSNPKTSFAANGKIFLLVGTNQVYSYNPSTNLWVKINNYPSFLATDAFSFTINNKVYIGGGYYSSLFWVYDPLNDIWTQKINLPNAMITPNISNAQFWCKSTFVVNGKGIVISYDGSVWEYNSESDSWIKKSNFPGGKRYYASSCSVGNNGYLGGGVITWNYSSQMDKYDDLWEYDNSTDSWIQKTSTPGNPRWLATSFSIGNKIYFGGGIYYNLTNNTAAKDYQFYEYDPTLEP